MVQNKNNKDQSLIRRGRSLSAKSIYATQSLEAIISTLKTGECLPSEREFCKKFNLSRGTLRTLLSKFEQRGLLLRRQGKGYFNISTEQKDTPRARFGLILPSSKINSELDVLSDSFTRACASSKMDCVIKAITTQEEETKAIKELSRSGVKAIAIYPIDQAVYSKEFCSTIASLKCSGAHIVLIDRYLPEIDTCYVVIDNHLSGYLVTRHLILLGHKKILNLASLNAGTSALAFFKGYKQALADFGITFNKDLVIDADYTYTYERAYSIIKEMLANGKALPFTAIVCTQDNHARGAMDALLETGINIPDDIAIVANGDRRDLSMPVPLTTIEQPMQQLAEKTVELLQKGLNGKVLPEADRCISVQPRLIIRESCGSRSAQIYKEA